MGGMVIKLPDIFDIGSDAETNRPCEFCRIEDVADPDDLNKWADHLRTVHGYRFETDKPGRPRKVRLALTGWSSRAKFQPNDRVTVNDKAPSDHQQRRGTVVGWLAKSSEYCVRFDEEPVIGWLNSDWLRTFVPQVTNATTN